MASITIRNLDDDVKRKLRIRAAVKGRSMEAEAREILCTAMSEQLSEPRKLGTAIHELFKPLGGVDLELPRL